MAQQQSSHSAENRPSWAFLQLVLPKTERKMLKHLQKEKKKHKARVLFPHGYIFLILLKHQISRTIISKS